MESHRDPSKSADKESVQHRYLLNGKEIDVNSTPDEIGLKESDVIRVAPLSPAKDHRSGTSSQSSASTADEQKAQAQSEAENQAKAAKDAQLERERPWQVQMSTCPMSKRLHVR